MKIFHNSHDINFRHPFGAVHCNQAINISIYVDIHGFNKCELILHECNNIKVLPMKSICKDNNIKTFIVTYQAPCNPGIIWYYFKIIKDSEIYYYGNNSSRLGGIGELYQNLPPAYQITVHLKNNVVAKWYKEGVMYQIYVDRFCRGNGNKTQYPKKNSLLHTSWDDTPLYIKDDKGHIKRWDFFGGNIKGLISKLDYLYDLGISIIYLNPIFEAPSNHKYDTGNYMQIDPGYGNLDIFKLLILETKKRGISIILDGVFSHTGSDSIYFNKFGNYDNTGAYQSPESPYYNWYKFNNFPNDYDCWWGVDSLPNVNELEPSYKKLIYNDEESIIKYWTKTGIKGWRLDVADELPDEFIKELKLSLKESDNDSVLIGEVWEDASNKISYDKAREYFYGDEFDSVMNYPFREIMISYILGWIDAKKCNDKIMSLYENYPKENFYSAMNIIGSHDRIRILTILGEPPDEQKLTDIERENYKLNPLKKNIAIKRLKLLSLLQFTFPGVPCIYYGDEVGIEGFSDPYNRGTYPWGYENKELLDWYKKIIYIRNNNNSLKRGEWQPYYCNGDIYSFFRILEKEKILCIFNRNKYKSHIVKVPPNQYKDLLNNSIIEINNELELAPLSSKIILTIN